MFYTTPTDDGAVAVTCDLCFAAVACPDPWAAAAAITHHRCDPDQATTHPRKVTWRWTASSRRPCTCWPVGGVASCPSCGFQLASARSQARCERRSRPPDLPGLPGGRLMVGPELDLMEGGRGPGAFSPGERIEHALLWENPRTRDGRPMRWAGFSVTGNADYVSLLALRARFLARGIRPSPRMAYQRHYRLVSERPRTTVWRSTR